MMLTPAVRRGLELLQAEFEGNQLEVVVVPSKRRANEGGGIRVALSRNADWYRRFCARHLSSRRRRNLAVDTRIKRRNVAALLAGLLAGRARSKYADEILRLAAQVSTKIEEARAC